MAKKKTGAPELKYDIGCVLWEDAVFYGDTHANGANIPHEPVVTLTSGLIVRNDKKGVSIAQDMFEDGKLRHLTFIPAPYIKEVVVYGKGRALHRGAWVEFLR